MIEVRLFHPEPLALAVWAPRRARSRSDMSDFFQLRPQRLEDSAVVLLQCAKAFDRVGRKGCAGIGRDLLDDALQRIPDAMLLASGVTMHQHFAVLANAD
jgi:hypothetical protein